MYSVTIERHAMVARSLQDERFGPASKLHGTTLIIQAEFFAQHLDDINTVLDISLAEEYLEEITTALNYSNLDEDPNFTGIHATIEFLCSYIHGALVSRLRGSSRDFGHIERLRVQIQEHPRASASFERDIDLENTIIKS